MTSQNTAIVTGAQGSIGRAICAQLVTAGWDVVGVDLTADSEPPAGIVSLALDITNEEAVDAAFAELAGERVAGLVNAAGINVRSDALECSAATFEKNFRVNLLGTFLMAREAARVMLAQGGGSIVNVASTMAFVGSHRHQASYAATKGGVVALTTALAVEWAGHGIRVNSIAPAFVDTPMNQTITADPVASANVLAQIPLGRYGTPQDMASAVAWLLSDESSFITGSTIRVDGGYLAL
ncbi:MAG: SDR family oxidoreductase [Propionicimonas sp.]|nr:SDR family oxidoreductase [Propionicimonas sp.]